MIKIGTRDSKLALWQAGQVQHALAEKGYPAELVLIKSEGDIDLVTPLYAMGVQGVFTRTLDAALLSGRIDIAVHSMKDVPTQLPAGIQQAAVLPRGPVEDVLVYRGDASPFDDPNAALQLATSSIRRKAQWLHRYPHTAFHNLRGNMQTRLSKLDASDWHGAIFAKAGLARIDLLPQNHIVLDWMLPAPAQGAVMVVCRQNDPVSLEAAATINHAPTALCTRVERDFLSALMGGCSTPISAHARVQGDHLLFQGNVCATDGSDLATLDHTFSLEAAEAGQLAAAMLLAQGGRRIVEKLNREGNA